MRSEDTIGEVSWESCKNKSFMVRTSYNNFLRPHLCQFVTECGNRHLFIHSFIISHLAVSGTFFCAVLP